MSDGAGAVEFAATIFAHANGSFGKSSNKFKYEIVTIISALIFLGFRLKRISYSDQSRLENFGVMRGQLAA